MAAQGAAGRQKQRGQGARASAAFTTVQPSFRSLYNFNRPQLGGASGLQKTATALGASLSATVQGCSRQSVLLAKM